MIQIGVDPRDAQSACRIMSAVNLSGVAHSLVEITGRLRAAGLGTREINRHPIVVCIVGAMAELSGITGAIGDDAYSAAYVQCRAWCVEGGLDPDA